MRHKLHCAVSLALFAVFTAASSASAQSVWTDQSSEGGVSLEFVKPQFAGENKPDFLTSVAYLSSRFAIGPKVLAEVELPVSRFSYSSDNWDASETAIGNPYLGVRIPGNGVDTRIGIRLPVASSDDGSALGIGFVGDYDRFEAYLPDVLTVSSSVMGLLKPSDQFTLKLGGGPVVSVLTKDTGGDQAEVFAQYALLAEVKTSPVIVQGGFTGRAIVTESDLSFAERSVHQFGLGVTRSSGTFRPGAHLRVPIDDDLGDAIDFVVGVHFTVVLQ